MRNERMRAAQRCLLALIIVAPAASCLTPQPAPRSIAPATSREATIEDRVTDLSALRNGILRRHPTPFPHASPADFNTAADQLAAQASQLDDDAWVVNLRRLAAMIGDAHTQVVLEVGKPPCQTAVPVRFVALADGIFISAAPTGRADLIAAKVIAVNGVPIDDVAARVRTFAACETDSAARVVLASYLRYDRLLHALGVIPQPGAVTLSLQRPNSTPEDSTIEARPANELWTGIVRPDPAQSNLPPGRTARREYYWYVFIPAGRVLYCRYDRCTNDPAKSVSTWAREVQNEIEKEKPRAVAIDLRHNGGGNSALLLPLVRSLRAWKAGDQSRQVFALIGPETFSSGITNALNLREFAGAILVGEQPGQMLGSFGEVTEFELPRSGIRVTCGTVTHADPSAPIPILPDITARMSSEAWFAGRDPAMDELHQAK